MSNFTHGEWKVKTVELDKIDIILKESKIPIAWINHYYKENSLANAYLISAAPEMYEALKKVCDIAVRSWKSDDPLLGMMLKAINKAEGIKDV